MSQSVVNLEAFKRSQDREASKAALAAIKPEWAAALIVAELEQDESDMQTDYFATSKSRHVALAWSKHTKDVFSEMRKAAALFPETAHLGPACGMFTPRVVIAEAFVSNGSAYYIGEGSPWHRDLDGGREPHEFTTKAEAEAHIAAAGEPFPIMFDGVLRSFAWKIEEQSVEHREKWSMGAGYYLKAGGRYSTGWRVRKDRSCGEFDVVEIHESLRK